MKYMNFSACSEHEKKKSAEEEQVEKAHLHDGVGDVVHVHREGGTWADLFTNIKYPLPPDSHITVYRNGEEVSKIITQAIMPDESIIIVLGSQAGVDTSTYISQEHIREVESKSELCGS
jgi:hypothetical protein